MRAQLHRGQASDQEADAEARDDSGPRARTVQLLVGDGRTDGVDRWHHEQRVQHLTNHDHHQPVPRRERRPALVQVLAEVAVLPWARCALRSHPCEADRADAEGDGIDGNRAGRADQRHECTTDGTANGDAKRGRRGQQAVGLLQPWRRHRLRNDPGQRRAEERLADAVDRHQGDEHPDRAIPGYQSDEDEHHDHATDQVARQHHEPSRQAIGPDAADQQEDRVGNRARGQHEANLPDRATHRENGEWQRDHRDRVADDRDCLGGQQQAEAAFMQTARNAATKTLRCAVSHARTIAWTRAPIEHPGG